MTHHPEGCFPAIGMHLSIAGGLDRALWRAHALGCQALQIFLQNPRGWRWRPVSASEAVKFHRARRDTGIRTVAAHLSYLPNLASPAPALYAASVTRLTAEWRLAQELELDFLICHPGHAPVEPASYARVAAALEAAAPQAVPSPRLLLENTAGQGSEIGWRLDQLHAIMRLTPLPVGLCLDTAHAFAAGYDLGRPAGVDALLGELSAGMGLTSLKVVHLNETRHPRDSHRDRHWHLDEGAIGAAGLSYLLQQVAGATVAVILETPKQTREDDPRNLAVARRLAGWDSPRRGAGLIAS